jgi:hypothetical protein
MANALLPTEFSDLEPYAATWCLATETERFDRRLASTMHDMQALYDAVLPRAEAMVEYCNGFPLDDMPEDAQRVMQLLYSLVMVSFPVEAWRQPNVPDSGAAALLRTVEPTP